MKLWSIRYLIRKLLFGKEIEQTNKKLRDSRTVFHTKQTEVLKDIEEQISLGKNKNAL